MIDSAWESFGGGLGFGARIPLGSGFSFEPTLGFGLADLDYDAVIRETPTAVAVTPETDGLNYSWDLDAVILGSTLGLTYDGDLGGKFELDAGGIYNHSYVSSYRTSSDLQDFSDHTHNITIKADISHPLGVSVAGIPLHGVLHLGSTTFFGASSDVLGFSNFSEVGFSIRTDISKLKSPISSLSLGAMVVFGDNISGWGLLAGYSF